MEEPKGYRGQGGAGIPGADPPWCRPAAPLALGKEKPDPRTLAGVRTGVKGSSTGKQSQTPPPATAMLCSDLLVTTQTFQHLQGFLPWNFSLNFAADTHLHPGAHQTFPTPHGMNPAHPSKLDLTQVSLCYFALNAPREQVNASGPWEKVRPRTVH